MFIKILVLKIIHFRLSLRDPKNTEKYFANDDLWEKSENALREILKELKVDYYEAEGEAAFYGPKIDVQVKSAIGHDVSLSTVQLDYQLPERFALEYIDKNGSKDKTSCNTSCYIRFFRSFYSLFT
jgi:threonyl-tRNA synthetase